jgi:WD40 repeat protein/class 3 adenylate cyclase
MAESGSGAALVDVRSESAERTFLIGDIRGYTRFTRERGDAEAARLAQLFASLAENAVQGRDGRVVEVRGDEVLAVFASPAHALRAALELLALCEEEMTDDLPLLAGVGIESGPAVAVGEGFRGTALNTAARLCSTAAAGEVLVTGELAHRFASLDDIVFSPRGTAELKGFDAPIELSVASPARRSRSFTTRDTQQFASVPVELETDEPLAGREAELAWLRGAWRRARRGSGSVLFSSGPAGIGKTRLAAELAAAVSRDGCRIAYVGAGGAAAALAQAAVSEAIEADVASLVVLDDLDATGESLGTVLADPAIATHPVLVLCLAREPERIRGLSQLLDLGRRDGGGHRALTGLDAAAVRDVAASYAGVHVDEAPLEKITRTSAGVPARVHELLDDWAGKEASRRLAAAAEWLAAERLDRSADLEFANSVIGRKLARLYSTEDGSARAVGACPYKGLASFEAADARSFFGRERLVGELAARTVGVGLLAVVGASGSGKSSVLAAGLVPSLAAGLLPGSERWSFAAVVPGERPSLALEAALARQRTGDRRVVVIDQFEEVFTVCSDEGERAAFIGRVVELAADPEQEAIVIGLRGDFYARCAGYPDFARLVAANQVLVGAMTADELKRAIELPARRAGARVDAALVETLAAEVGDEPGALPLLSTALVELWFEQSDGRLRLESHQRLGGMRGAVARLAESSHENLDDAQRDAAQRLFLRLVTVGAEGVATRRRVSRAELDLSQDAVLASVVERLTEDRLLTADETSVEIAHEALLREWPRLEGWLADDAHGRELREHLIESAKRWDEAGREPAELYRGPRLAATLDWAAPRAVELNALERDFLDESRRNGELEAERQRRQNRRLRIALVAAAVLLAAAVVAGVLALIQRSQARSAATAAVAQSLGAQGVSEPRIDLAMLLARGSVALDPTVRTRSDLLTTLLRVPTLVRTYHWNANRNSLVAVSPDGRTIAIDDNNAHTVVEDTATGARIGTVGADTIGFGPDGSLLTAPGGALGGRSGVIVVRNARSPRLAVTRTIPFPPSFRTPSAGVAVIQIGIANGRLAVELTRSRDTPDGPQTVGAGVAQYDYSTGRPAAPLIKLPVSADGFSYVGGDRRLIYSDGQSLTVLDATTGRRIRTYPVGATPFAVTRNGRTLAFAAGEAVSFLDLRTGKVTPGIGSQAGGVDRMSFTPDGNTLVTSGEDGQTLVWDVPSHSVRETLTGHAGPIHGQAMSTDGSTLYTGSFDTNALGWDLTGDRSFPPTFQAVKTDPAAGAWTLAISPDSRTVAVGSTTGKVSLWNAKTLRPEQTFAAAPGVVSAVAFGDHGHELLVASDAGVHRPTTAWLRVWRLGPDPSLVRTINVHGFLSWAAWSPDGRTLVGTAASAESIPGSKHGFVRAWNASTGRTLWTSAVKHGYPLYATFAPRGKALAVSEYESGAEVLDPSTGAVESKLAVPGLYTFGASYSPDGTKLATTDWDGTLDLWNPKTGASLAKIPDPDKGVGSSVAWSPDGQTIALTDQSNTLRLFDVATRREIGPPFQLGAPFQNDNPYAAFTRDGTHVVVSDDTGRTWVVPVKLSAWEAAACRIANRNLTRAEWNEFLPGRQYRRFCP